MNRITCWIKGHLWVGVECIRCGKVDMKAVKEWLKEIL